MYSQDVVVFRWSGPRVGIEIVLEPYKPTIFIGFNNVLKSITARMIIAMLSQQDLIDKNWSIPERDWRGYLEKIVATLGGGSNPVIGVADTVKERKLGYVLLEDSRIALRKYMEIRELYQSSMDRVESIIEKLSKFSEIPPPLLSELLRSFEDVKSIVDGIGFGIGEIYYELKLKAFLKPSSLYMSILEDIVEDVLNELGKNVQREELIKENMLSLDVEVVGKDGEKRVVVTDTRTREQIDEVMVSTSVSSMLLFKTLALAMAIPIPKLIVVEEPEYALAPIQQIILARFVEESLNKAKELGHTTYIILVTHSPYIALGMRKAENAKVYYFMYSKEGKFIAEESWPAREFALASLLMLGSETKS